MRHHLSLITALAALSGGWCAAAETAPQTTESTTSSTAKLTDQSFVEQAASGGMFEVKSSQLALTKDVPAEERKFAEQMTKDHEKANKELKTLADKKKWTIKKDLMPDDQRRYDQLAGYTGDEFTRNYAMLQLKAHDEAVSLFERGSREVADQDLKKWINETLPTLQHHREMAAALPYNAARSGTQSGSLGSDGSAESSLPHKLNQDGAGGG
jgi:putative membrane protein